MPIYVSSGGTLQELTECACSTGGRLDKLAKMCVSTGSALSEIFGGDRFAYDLPLGAIVLLPMANGPMQYRYIGTDNPDHLGMSTFLAEHPVQRYTLGGDDTLLKAAELFYDTFSQALKNKVVLSTWKYQNYATTVSVRSYAYALSGTNVFGEGFYSNTINMADGSPYPYLADDVAYRIAYNSAGAPTEYVCSSAGKTASNSRLCVYVTDKGVANAHNIIVASRNSFFRPAINLPKTTRFARTQNADGSYNLVL